MTKQLLFCKANGVPFKYVLANHTMLECIAYDDEITFETVSVTGERGITVSYQYGKQIRVADDIRLYAWIRRSTNDVCIVELNAEKHEFDGHVNRVDGRIPPSHYRITNKVSLYHYLRVHVDERFSEKYVPNGCHPHYYGTMCASFLKEWGVHPPIYAYELPIHANDDSFWYQLRAWYANGIGRWDILLKDNDTTSESP